MAISHYAVVGQPPNNWQTFPLGGAGKLSDLADQQRLRLLEATLTVLGEATAQPDLAASCNAFVEQFVLAVRPDSMGALFVPGAAGTWVLQAGFGLQLKGPEGIALTPAVIGKLEATLRELRIPALYPSEVYAETFAEVMHPTAPRPFQALFIPVLLESELIGILHLEHHDTARPFTEADINLAAFVASQFANHLHNASLFEDTRRREKELASLNKLLQTVNSTLDLDEILRIVHRSLQSIFRFDVVALYTISDNSQLLQGHHIYGKRVDNQVLDEFRRWKSPIADQGYDLAKVLLYGETLVMDAAQMLAVIQPGSPLTQLQPISGAAFFPLMMGGTIVGMACFFNRTGDILLKPQQTQQISRFTSQVVTAIDNSRRYEESQLAQRELMVKNLAIQSKTEEIRSQNVELSIQSRAILHQSQELESLVKIMQAINQELELEKVLDMLLDEGILMIPGAEKASFLVFDAEARVFTFIAQKGFDNDAISQITLTWQEAFGRYVQPAAEIFPNIYRLAPAPKLAIASEKAKDFPDTAAMLVMGILVKEAVVGFMVFDNYTDPEAFGDVDSKKLQRFHQHATTAFQKARYLRKIQQQKEELEGAYAKLSDSLTYARKILEAILPRLSEVYQGFPNSFILYKPKEIVSGDFYWYAEREDHLVIAAVDCTGHGIPGAFMNVLGNTLLGQIVNEKGLSDPGLILAELDQRIKHMLGQFDAESESFDGMDLCLCVYWPARRELQYAGANRPLYCIHEGKLEEHKGNRHPVGGRQYHDSDAGFQTTSFTIAPGDRIYLSTDGYADQFSDGPRQRKFLNKRLKELILRLQDQPMPAQGELLWEEINKWRGRSPQLDDILVMGIQF